MYQKCLYTVMALVLGLGTGLMGQNVSPFRQDPGADGIVCVAAETYHANV